MTTKTILIADDEQMTRRGLKKTLELWSADKYEIISAADGPEAYELFSKHRIHLLITDVCMPEMDGLELLKNLKDKGYKPVVVIISGFPDFQYAQEAIRLGVINYLLKPVSKQKLIEAVEQAMETEASMERAEYMEKVADKKLLPIDGRDHLANSPIKEAISFINHHFNRQISLKEVADSVHLNASYFSVLFKEQTRLTFSEYLTRRRLQAAKVMLLTTDSPIEDIALKVGYQTAKYFIKIFKDYEGITPSKYRKTAALDEIQT
ncbi:response regulator [Neobacillus sp. MM2021_6]|uniref:response regulator transcription factor n=1 Tax=Bacillaceae TaxID=186817 RepID=UPI00140A87D2|nr:MULTISPECIES: response regulator [Bacillaceae]MBO0958716.1 response regulator [Neobacillus sp. MM2021_6]NHC18189.1 response regulator [Bacillus sp. MM2020_4]